MPSDDDHHMLAPDLRHFVRAYVARRVRPDHVDDIVSEVFLVAWRRRTDVPQNALPWLYRTARNVIGNRYRSIDRQRALREKLRAVPTEAVADPAEAATERNDLVAAFERLDDDERELLLLAAWEGLSIGDIAEVLGVSKGAVSTRLHRARSRLDAEVSTDQMQLRKDR